MSIESSSYKSVIKSTAVFGGAQIIQMLITILRAKFIAIFLGTAGMGINAIFQSSIATINNFSSFGIFQSAVRDISQAHESGDLGKLSRIKAIFERLVWLTGILGTLICIVSAQFLSKFAFGSSEYTMSFVLLSASLLFMALANGKTVILQGTRNLSYLAKASVIGAFLSLAIGIPLYYYLKINGIVLSIVIGYFVFYLTRIYYSRKINFTQLDQIGIEEIWFEGKPIIKLGTVLMFGTVLITVFTYLTNVIIGRLGSIEDVGLFQGASSITTQSIIVIISVLASDFFPRLSAISDDIDKVKIIANQQVELITLIIAPIVVLLICLAPVIVRLLLTHEFLVIIPMLRWMALAILFRGVWITMSYIILAKGDKKAYFIYDALIGNGLNFVINIIAYAFWGLQGLGISFVVGSILVSILLYLIVYKKYGFELNYGFILLFLKVFSFVILSFLITYFLNDFLLYICSAIIILITLYTCLAILNIRIGIYQIIANRIFIQKK